MAKKWFVKPKRIINNIFIIIIRVFTIANFHVVLGENGAYPMIFN
jgi:hypothetical protein